MPTQSNLQLFKDALPIPATLFPETLPQGLLSIEIKPGETSLHTDLPPTQIWGYNGTYPGPIIEVRKNQKIYIEWKNLLKAGETEPHGTPNLKAEVDPKGPLHGEQRVCIPARLPMKAVTSASDTQSEAGASGGSEDKDLKSIPPFIVAHLHGAKTHPDSDGWTDNGTMLGQSYLCTYENINSSALFWYHDHAMGITRFNVFAGLAGLYILRDPEELALKLPSGPFEIPLLLQDRNLDTDENGNLTGQLLHKVEGRTINYVDPNRGNTTIIVQDGTMEFFGPFNLVNGKISPYLAVKRGHYRLRMVNGSNGRTYKLKMLFDNNNLPFTDQILYQIGSDGGLLSAPIALGNNEIILAPGERADLIADFSSAALKGRKINWVNVASAPYDGTDVDFTNPKTLDNNPDIWNALRQRNACVLQFSVEDSDAPVANFVLPKILSSRFVRTTHNSLPTHHNHRLIALVEEAITIKDSNGNPIPDPSDPESNLSEPMLMMRELKKIAQGEIIPAGAFSITMDGVTYKSIGAMFYDTTNFLIKYGSSEVWKIINLTGDTHPFHVHLVQFQALGRQTFHEDITTATGSANSIGSMNFNITLLQPKPDESLLDANEKGWKDTIRVNPNEMMSIAMTFDGYNGKFMYHCHLLEHEDKEMMRPFNVLPEAIIQKMNMGDHHQH